MTALVPEGSSPKRGTMMHYGYLGFALTMLYMVERSKLKHIPRENIFTFFVSILPTELSHKLIAMNAAAIWWLRRQSKTPLLSGWVGATAGFVQCVVCMQLMTMYKSNVHAKSAMRTCLTDAGIVNASVKQLGALSWKQWLSVLLPIPQPTALSWCLGGVRKAHTVTYARVGKNRTTKLRMDVYKHSSNTKSGAPIFLYIHGGGWVLGHRWNPPLPLIHQVTNLGWVVCVIDYRLSPKIAFPDHLIDSKRAVAYLRRNARTRFDADPGFIVVAGESAGGHLASLVALSSADKSFQPGFEEDDTSVQGCVDTYGVHDFADRHGLFFYKDEGHSFRRFLELMVMQRKLDESSLEFEKASPIAWLQSNPPGPLPTQIPPFLVAHGTLDTLVPIGDSSLFFEHLLKYRAQQAITTPEQNEDALVKAAPTVKDVFLEIPGAHHAFNYLLSPRTLAYGEAVCVFLDHLYQNSYKRDDHSMSMDIQDQTMISHILPPARSSSENLTVVEMVDEPTSLTSRL